MASYDYTVLAGTQGTQNHRKKDRLFELAAELRLPVVFFTEGGGGRPGDSEAPGPTGLDCLAFLYIAELSGLVPLVGINAGYCFAGNAALLGVCDVVIATEDSNIGMGGPAMIEGGGLGVHEPTAIGPIDVQRANGVVDIVVADEAEGVAVAKRYLSYFQGVDRRVVVRRPGDCCATSSPRTASGPTTSAPRSTCCSTPARCSSCAATSASASSPRWRGSRAGRSACSPTTRSTSAGRSTSTAPTRRPGSCSSATRSTCRSSRCATRPGSWSARRSRRWRMVRHCNRMFVNGANLTVPTVAVVLRKAYGLGAQAMMGGSTKAPLACLAWPTGEFGGMGLEGAVRLGYRRELDAIDDEAERAKAFDDLVARAYEVGKGVSVATYFEIDDVIDPADTRRWLTSLLAAAPAAAAPHRQEAPQHRHLVTA